MNIFVVDLDPIIAGKSLCDKHIVKMILESAQLLCSYFPQDTAPYKRAYYLHPASIWVRKSLSNYKWLIEHSLSLCEEYTFRYGKVHKSQEVIEWCRDNIKGLEDIGLTSFVQAMPDECKITNDPVNAYRKYYRLYKKDLLTYTKRKPPEWIIDIALWKNK